MSETTVFHFNTRPLSGGVATLTIQRVGTTEFHGVTRDIYRGTYPADGGTKAVEIYGEIRSPSSAEVAGYRVVFPTGSGKTNYTVTLDPPQTLDADQIPLGVPQERELSGSVDVEGGVGHFTGKVLAHYTKTDDNATFASELGTLTHVQVFEGDMTLVEADDWPLLNLFKGQKGTGKVWFHPAFGILKIEVNEWPMGVDLTGEESCGNPTASGYNTIQKVGVVSTQNRTFKLSSHGCSGDFDADKMRHAQMLLELRWAEDDKARTEVKPEVAVSFQTVWGEFLFTLVMSNVSIFHPEENGQGYIFWYALVDEAAKNEPGENGISYGVRVDFPDFMTSPVRATARIRYPIYQP